VPMATKMAAHLRWAGRTRWEVGEIVDLNTSIKPVAYLLASDIIASVHVDLINHLGETL